MDAIIDKMKANNFNEIDLRFSLSYFFKGEQKTAQIQNYFD